MPDFQTPYTLYQSGQVLLLASSPVLLLILLFVDAPYGKRNRAGWGPAIPVRLAWLLLEVPSFIVPIWVLFDAGIRPGLPASVLLLLWLAHYFDRSFVYPWRIRSKPGQTFKLVMLVLGAPMNALIGYLIGHMILAATQLQQNIWLSDPRFLIGLMLFFAGLVLTKQADGILRGLRGQQDSGYYIPYGWPYRWLSCPNYAGEILQWSGFALACWSLPAVAFLLYTCANLVPRALASHRWYQGNFAAYPSERKAILPFLL